jgi:hypothetical protein
MSWNEYEIKNAKIDGTSLGIQDHGIFTFSISLDYGGSGQSFGGFVLDDKPDDTGKRRGSAFGCDAILQVLRVVGVDRWEDLVGKSVRAEARHDKVKRLGNYLSDDWLDLKELAKEFND